MNFCCLAELRRLTVRVAGLPFSSLKASAMLQDCLTYTRQN